MKPEYMQTDDLILAERDRQDRKWGEQNYTDEWWLAILMEEVGELSQAVLERRFGGPHGTATQIKSEAVQVAAVAHALLECIIRRSACHRPEDTVPREKVQAAVDDVQRAFAPCACGACLTCDLRAEHGEVIDDVISDVFGKLRHHTGVTPSEVPNA